MTIGIKSTNLLQSKVTLQSDVQERFSVATAFARLAENPAFAREVKLTGQDVAGVFNAALESDSRMMSEQYTPFDPYAPMPTTEELKAGTRKPTKEQKLAEKSTDRPKYISGEEWGFWDTMALPMYWAGSAYTILGGVAQNVRLAFAGEAAQEIDFAAAWDYHDNDHIDFGTSALFALGQIYGIAGDVAALALPKDTRKAISEDMKEWGLGMLRRDYDIFDAEDRDYQSGAQGLNVGTVLTQGLNFAGEVVLDFSNLAFFGAGKLAKLASFGSRKLSVNDVNERDFRSFNNLLNAGEEGIPALREAGSNNHLKMFDRVVQSGNKFAVDGKRNISPTVVQRTVYRDNKDFQSQKAAAVVAEIGNLAKTDDEAVHLMSLAVAALDGESPKALATLVRYFDKVEGGRPAAARALKGLDDLHPDGPFLIRSGYDDAILDTDLIKNPAMKEKTEKYFELLDDYVKYEEQANPVLRRLLDAGTDVKEGERIFGAGGIRNIAPARTQIGGAAETFRAELAAYKIGDFAEGTQWFLPGIGTTAFHIISAPGRIAGTRMANKQQFNLKDNHTMGDFERLATWANKADSVLKGSLSRSGRVKQLLDDYRSAQTPRDRQKFIIDFEQEVLETMAAKRGIRADTIKEAGIRLNENRFAYRRQMRRAGYAINRQGDVIIDESSRRYRKDPLLVSQQDEIHHAWDWGKVDEILKVESLNPLLKGDSILSVEKLIGARDAAIQAAAFVQRNWSVLVLLRPPRFLRELYAGGVGAVMSGEMEIYRHIRNGTLRQATKNLKAQTRNLFARKADQIYAIGAGRSTIREIDDSIKTVDGDIKDIDKLIAEYEKALGASFTNKSFNELTPMEKKVILDFNASRETETVYHARYGDWTSVKKGKLISSYSDSTTANKHSSLMNNVEISSVEDLASFRRSLKNKKVAVQRQTPNGKWVYITDEAREALAAKAGKDNLTDFSGKKYRVFKLENKPKITKVVAHGKSLDFSDWQAVQRSGLAGQLGITNSKDWGKLIGSGDWMNKKITITSTKKTGEVVQREIAVGEIVSRWGAKNGYGKFSVADPNAIGGRSVFVVPEFAGVNKETSQAAFLNSVKAERRRVSADPDKKFTDEDIATRRKSRETLTATQQKKLAIIEDLKKKTLPSEASLEETLEALKKLNANRRELEQLRRRYVSVKAKAVAKSSKLRERPESAFGGESQFTYTDETGKPTTVNYKNAFAGEEGHTIKGSLIAGQGSEVRTGPFSTRTPASRVVNVEVKANDPEYFDAMSQMINRNILGVPGYDRDPVMLMMAQGKSRAFIRKWLKTNDGKAYANKTFRTADKDGKVLIEYIQPEEFLDDMAIKYNTLFYDEAVNAKLLNNEPITEEFLRETLGGRQDLPSIVGSILDPIERQGAFNKLGEMIGQATEFLADLPTKNLLGTPVFANIYRKEMERRILAFSASRGRQPNVNELAAMTKKSRSFALTDMRKYIYNAGETTNAAQFLRWFVPFINAQVFTAKMLASATFENPKMAAWMLYQFNKAVQAQTWVDSNGNPVDSPTKATGLVFPVNEEWANILKDVPLIGDTFKFGAQFKINKSTLDPLFGGNFVPIPGMEASLPNPFAPGLGPFVGIAVSELTKLDPSNEFLHWMATGKRSGEFPDEETVLEEIAQGFFPGALPFGASRVPLSLDMIIPGKGASYLINLTGAMFNNNEGWTADWMGLMARVMAYEEGRYNTGEREGYPTADEVRKTTWRIYNMRFANSFLTASPASVNVQTEFDLAYTLFRRYKEAYGAFDGEMQFLIDHPDLFYATVGTTKNRLGLDPLSSTVEGLKEHRDLVGRIESAGGGGIDVLSYILSPGESYEFNDAAYAYLRSEGLLEVMSPLEIQQEVRAKAGWASFKRGMDEIDNLAIINDTTIEESKELQGLVTQLKQRVRNNKTYGEAWNAAYSTYNPNRRNQIISAFEEALSDEKWMAQHGSKREIVAIATFIDMRNQIQNTLYEKAIKGEPYTLKSNPQLRSYYFSAIANLKANNIQFAEFYNRYFEGDEVQI